MDKPKRYIPMVLAIFLSNEAIRFATAGQQVSKRVIELRLALIAAMAGTILAVALPPHRDVHAGAITLVALGLAFNLSVLWVHRRAGRRVFWTRKGRRQRMAELAQLRLPEDDDRAR